MHERSGEINPFEDGTAPSALRSLPSFEEALSRLMYLADHGRQCGIVRGPAGVGKTPLLETVIRELRHQGQRCGFLDLRRTSPDEFPRQLACELGTVPSPSEPRRDWRLVEDAILGRALAGRVTVLVLDHLGELGTDLQLPLQRLLAIVESSAGWCTVLGAARNESPVMDRLIQKHSELRIELGPLDLEETARFLHHLIELTGCCPFDDEAVRILHEASRGVLRTLMTLGRLALLARSAADAPHVTGEIVRQVAAEVAPSSPRPPRIMADDSPRFATVD